jgi:hypothetical protein
MFSCTKEENSENPNANDPSEDFDGDGVKNIIEEVDGTNPQGACSYDSNHQDYAATSQGWRDQDCDEDGVSNGKEMDPDGDGTRGPNETSPRNLCDYNQNDQDFTKTTSFWRDIDCDQDGVTNGDEVDPDGNGQNNTNGTDPLDQCDLVIAQQTLPPSNYWLTFDCDDDCRLNYQEIEEGTDPLDGTDFIGSGDELLEIRSIRDDGTHLNTYLFDQQGTRYLGAETANGQVLAALQYDGNNNLIEVDIPNADPAIHISFEYQSGVISKTTHSEGSSVIIKDVQFSGNEIVTVNGDQPAGLFTEKFNLDPSSNKVMLKEEYFKLSSNDYRYYNSEYIYDSTKDNLLRITTSIQGYTPSTGEYYQLVQGGWSSHSFDYDDATALNPGYLATQNIYLHMLLEPDVLYNDWFFGASDASISKRYLTGFKFGNDFFLFHAGMSVLCEQVTFLPTKGYYLTLNGQLEFDFIYE